jgi:integrase
MRSSGKPPCAKFGPLRPDQITTAHCREYAKDRTEAGIKPGSVRTELGHLRACFALAEKSNLITKAPAIKRPPKPAPKELYLTRAEAALLLDADCEPHIRPACLLMLTTSGRVSAILDLTWNRVDLERGQVNLRRDTVGRGKVVPSCRSTTHCAQR